MNGEPIDIFQARQFHWSIVEVSGARFTNGDYWAAILGAAACVDTKVKEVLGTKGSHPNLMGYAFDGNEPRIRLANDMELHTGLAMIFKGMMKAIRNPKAHDPFFTQSDTGKTLDYLGLMSLLLRRIDERVSPGEPTATTVPTTPTPRAPVYKASEVSGIVHNKKD